MDYMLLSRLELMKCVVNVVHSECLHIHFCVEQERLEYTTSAALFWANYCTYGY